MVAAVLTSPGVIELQETIKPTYNDQQVLIKVEGCGICASSIPLWEGREWFSYPVEPGKPGHEGWGIVEAIGENVRNISEGDRVAFLTNHAFAEYDIADVQSLVKLPVSLNGLPFPAEPLGCAMNIFERSDITANDTVAIIGMGFLGALLCQLAKHAGAKVIAISRRQYSLDIAKQYGADECIPFTHTWEVANKVAEITGGQFCSRVVEAAGKQEAIDLATEIVAEYGKFIVAGYHQDGLRQVNFQKWNWKAIDVINAHERAAARYLSGMQQAVEAVSNGILQPQSLYTHVLPLSQVSKGFQLTCDRPDGFVKALVTMQD